MLEWLLVLLFELFAEVVLQLIAELFAEVLIRLLRAVLPGRWNGSSLLAAAGISCVGALAGALSVALYPEHLLKTPGLRGVALVAVPLVVGLVMGFRGRLLRRKGKLAIRLNTFTYAFLFALCYSLIRYQLAR